MSTSKDQDTVSLNCYLYIYIHIIHVYTKPSSAIRDTSHVNNIAVEQSLSGMAGAFRRCVCVTVQEGEERELQ